VAWALWALAMFGVPVIGWLDHLLRQAGRPELAPLTADAATYVLGLVSAATVGRWWPAAGPITRWAGCCWPLDCRWWRPG
jgi:hypothetical protein